MAEHRSVDRARARSESKGSLLASAIAFSLFALVAAAYTGHAQPRAAHEGAEAAHRMTSLNEIEAVIRKAQSESAR